MSELQIFDNEEFGEIRVLEIENEPWFVGKDAAEILGYENLSRDINRHVDEEDRFLLTKQKYQNGTLEIPNRGLLIINESGLYSLILSSKLPNAKKFKRWVTSEVLPTIRKHGAYMTDNALEQAIANPDFMIGLLQNLKKEKEEKKRLQEEKCKLEIKIEEDRPKVTFAERVMKSGDNILVRELAKIISDEGFTIGEKRLYTQLRKWGYVCKNSTEPTQRAMNQKYFVVKVGTINTPYGIKEIKTTQVTPKGQIRIVERILEENK